MINKFLNQSSKHKIAEIVIFVCIALIVILIPVYKTSKKDQQALEYALYEYRMMNYGMDVINSQSSNIGSTKLDKNNYKFIKEQIKKRYGKDGRLLGLYENTTIFKRKELKFFMVIIRDNTYVYTYLTPATADLNAELTPELYSEVYLSSQTTLPYKKISR